MHEPVLLLRACDSVKQSLPDGEVEGVLMSVGGSKSRATRTAAILQHVHVQRQHTCMGVHPKYASGGVRPQYALQRANGDAVIAAERDGYAP